MNDEEYHSIRTHASCTGMRMNACDILTILTTIQIYPEPVDFRLILFTLKQQGFITHDVYDGAIEKISRFRGSCTESLILCIRELARIISFADLVLVLKRVGQTKFALTLEHARYASNVQVMPAGRSLNSTNMHQNYTKLKIIVGNNSFHVNKYVDFQNITSSLISRMNRHVSPRVRQQVFDNIVVVVCLRVHMYENISTREAILQEMFAAGDHHKDLDLTCAKVVYLVSKCYIARKENKVEEARGYISDAKQLCLNYDNSLIKALVFHAEHALYRKVYALKSDGVTLNQSVVCCERGISSISEEPGDIRQPWVRDFQLFKALTLLEIGQELKIEDSSEVARDNRENAKAILIALKRDFCEWSDRRETMYRVCMSRVYESSDLKLAMKHVELAMETGQRGNYTVGEHQHLQEYKESLMMKLSGYSNVNQPLSESSSDDRYCQESGN